MRVRELVVVVGVALVLAFGGGGDDADEAPAVEPVPAVVAAPPAVPLAISETTRPFGWVNPADRTAEQALGAWLAWLGGIAAWQLTGATVTVVVLAALVVSLERSRYTT
jgi:hypothetical protein